MDKINKTTTPFGIGIDTGGTFTDAVLMDLSNGRVLASAKTPTTHNDLRVCLGRAIAMVSEAEASQGKDVNLVAISSTLATNAVVENRGGEVGLFVIGHETPMNLPVSVMKHFAGGHTITGDEQEQLDLPSMVDTLAFLRGKVDAYAVVAAMSFVNPAHEEVAAKAIAMVDPKPVFLSHRLSSRPGLHERAATAVLNARLMPVMESFLSGMADTLASRDMKCRLAVVRSDGTVMDMAQAVREAAHTVGSGPAATVWFGASAAPGKDALVVDVGGTTTDIARVAAGRPLLDKEGSQIATWRTHVESVDTLTVGLGGDSHVRLHYGEIVLGPRRVTPVCLATGLPDPACWLGQADTGRCLFLNSEVSSETRDAVPLLRLLAEKGPTPWRPLAQAMEGESNLEIAADEWTAHGIVGVAGFTPTDALHVLGAIDFGNREAAWLAASVLGEAVGMSAEDFSRQVVTRAEEIIEDAILDFILRRDAGQTLEGFWPGRRRHPLLGVTFQLRAPIIGLGAAAGALLPGVARRLSCELILPEHHNVGNAVGALLVAKGEWTTKGGD